MVDRQVGEHRGGDEGQPGDDQAAHEAAEREGEQQLQGEAGEESWSWIAPWNFCWRIEDELLAKALIANDIMIRPGMTKTT